MYTESADYATYSSQLQWVDYKSSKRKAILQR